MNKYESRIARLEKLSAEARGILTYPIVYQGEIDENETEEETYARAAAVSGLAIIYVTHKHYDDNGNLLEYDADAGVTITDENGVKMTGAEWCAAGGKL